MALIDCVEPGKALDKDAQGAFKGKYMVDVQAPDDLRFPAVDSCLAIALVLADGRYIGGHVGEFWHPDDVRPAYAHIPKGFVKMGGNYDSPRAITCRAVADEMLAAKGNASITCALMVGDAAWLDQVREVAARLGDCGNVLFIKKNGKPRTHYQMDVYLDRASGNYRITEAGKNNVYESGSLGSIKGIDHRPIK